MKIKMLSEETIQKIAAGEVIENPASIVKELVENAIDAGATEIVVEIENGGKEKIQVIDNGYGMIAEELPLAFARHSTSKLSQFSDLYSLHTLGFRGEALASIVAIAKVEAKSKTSEQSSGLKLIYEKGSLLSQKPIGMNQGTVITISRLFQYLPVRKKFLRSDITEANAITHLMYRFAIGNPGISFLYLKDNRELLKTKPGASLMENLTSLFGKDYTNNIIPIHLADGDIDIHGYLTNNLYYRANRSMQYLFVNNRYVEDLSVRDTVETAYKAIIPNGRFPAWQIFVTINPSLIDVNVHPNKQKIKFVYPEKLLVLLSHGIAEALSISRQIPRISANNDGEWKNLYREKDLKRDKESHDKTNVKPSVQTNRPLISKSHNDPFKQTSQTIRYPDHVLEPIKEDYDLRMPEEKYRGEENRPASEPQVELGSVPPEFINGKDLHIIGTFLNTYILCELTKENQLCLIDQHAAHERILYEKFRKDMEQGKVVTQTLISPYVIELKENESELVMKQLDQIGQFGYILEPFGKSSYAIRGVPILLGIPDNFQMFYDLIDFFCQISPQNMDKTVRKIIQFSCRKAVKSGNRLNDKELKNLVDQLFASENPYTCPHGRPTMIQLSKKELEKYFLRIK